MAIQSNDDLPKPITNSVNARLCLIYMASIVLSWKDSVCGIHEIRTYKHICGGKVGVFRIVKMLIASHHRSEA
jgi:hypothetical protein